MEKLLSVEAAAQALGGISPWTVRAWLSQRKLLKVKIGRRTMIAESELERFLSDNAKRAGVDAKPTFAQGGK